MGAGQLTCDIPVGNKSPLNWIEQNSKLTRLPTAGPGGFGSESAIRTADIMRLLNEVQPTPFLAKRTCPNLIAGPGG